MPPHPNPSPPVFGKTGGEGLSELSPAAVHVRFDFGHFIVRDLVSMLVRTQKSRNSGRQIDFYNCDEDRKMTNTTTTLYASFIDISDAERATGALLDYGLHSGDITLVANEGHAERIHSYHGAAVMDENAEPHADGGKTGITTTPPGGEPPTMRHADGGKTGITTTTPADAGAGAMKGAGVGLGVGVAAALAAVFLPGVGLVLGGGALALALGGAAGATAAGAIAGGALGFLKDQGMPDHAVKTYTDSFEAGGAVLAVSLNEKVTRTEIEAVLSKYNAQNMNTYGQPSLVAM